MKNRLFEFFFDDGSTIVIEEEDIVQAIDYICNGLCFHGRHILAIDTIAEEVTEEELDRLFFDD